MREDGWRNAGWREVEEMEWGSEARGNGECGRREFGSWEEAVCEGGVVTMWE